MENRGLRYFSGVLLKGSIAISLAEASSKVIGLILLPVFTYYLSPEEFGLVSIVTVISSFLGLIYNPGMTSATIRLYHDTSNENDRQIIIGSAFRFFILFPLIMTFAAFMAGPFIFPSLFTDLPFYPYGILAILIAFFTQPKRIWVQLMALQYKVRLTALYTVISVLIGTVTALTLVVIFKLGALGKVLAMFPPALLMFIISFRAVKTYSEGKWSIYSIKKQLYMGLPLIIAIWSYEVLHISDRYILERMTDISQVGLYSFGYTIAQVPLFLVLGIRQLWNPIFYENMNRRDYKTVSKLISVYVIFIASICLFLLLFVKETIIILINERYYDAIPVVGVIVIGVYFSSLLTITNSFLGFEKKFGTTSKIASVAAVSNIALNIILIPDWGIMGAAMATLISYLLYLVIGVVAVKSYITILRFIPVFLYTSIYLIAVCVSLMVFASNEIRSYEIFLKVVVLITFVTGLFTFRIVKTTDIKKIKSLILKK